VVGRDNVVTADQGRLAARATAAAPAPIAIPCPPPSRGPAHGLVRRRMPRLIGGHFTMSNNCGQIRTARRRDERTAPSANPSSRSDPAPRWNVRVSETPIKRQTAPPEPGKTHIERPDPGGTSAPRCTYSGARPASSENGSGGGVTPTARAYCSQRCSAGLEVTRYLQNPPQPPGAPGKLPWSDRRLALLSRPKRSTDLMPANVMAL
jgi:hypothetical protein